LTETGGKIKITTEDGAASLALNGGELFALSKAYNTQIPSYQNELDLVAKAIYEQVNTLHSSGYSNTEPPATGVNFFSSYDSGVLKLNSEIVDNVNLISISEDGTSGNNSIALQISKLQDEKLIDGITISEKYSNFVSGLGNDKRVQEQNLESYELVLNQLELQKAEYSGVSVDEEMVNVLKFQRSYDASARLIKVADEILQTLLSMV
jgi:flagellar hook-associated protein 1 FlgK